MPNKKQRMKNRKTAEKLKRAVTPGFVCRNCGMRTHDGHFVPPSFGEEGFYYCTEKGQSDSRIVNEVEI